MAKARKTDSDTITPKLRQDLVDLVREAMSEEVNTLEEPLVASARQELLTEILTKNNLTILDKHYRHYQEKRSYLQHELNLLKDQAEGVCETYAREVERLCAVHKIDLYRKHAIEDKLAALVEHFEKEALAPKEREAKLVRRKYRSVIARVQTAHSLTDILTYLTELGLVIPGPEVPKPE